MRRDGSQFGLDLFLFLFLFKLLTYLLYCANCVSSFCEDDLRISLKKKKEEVTKIRLILTRSLSVADALCRLIH